MYTAPARPAAAVTVADRCCAVGRFGVASGPWGPRCCGVWGVGGGARAHPLRGGVLQHPAGLRRPCARCAWGVRTPVGGSVRRLIPPSPVPG